MLDVSSLVQLTHLRTSVLIVESLEIRKKYESDKGRKNDVVGGAVAVEGGVEAAVHGQGADAEVGAAQRRRQGGHVQDEEHTAPPFQDATRVWDCRRCR